jgi:hypothetical protein
MAMQRVTLKFQTLQLLSECMFMLSIQAPVIDYENYLLTADLTDKQVEEAVECDAQIIEQIVMK